MLAEVALSVELFMIRRPMMTPEEIDAALEGYLVRRKKERFPPDYLLEWLWLPMRAPGDPIRFGRPFDIDVSRLFFRTGVRLDPRSIKERHLLLAYAGFPGGLRSPPPREPGPDFPTLRLHDPSLPDLFADVSELSARTNPNAQLHLRMAAGQSGQSIGCLAGDEVRVIVLEKELEEDPRNQFRSRYEFKNPPRTWYHIRTEEPLSVTERPLDDGTPIWTTLQSGTEAWLAGGLFVRVRKWPDFVADLFQLEQEVGAVPLAMAITRLRQLSSERKGGFDDVIGTPTGPAYIEDIPWLTRVWQMFRDYEAFEAPDGRWVDFHHLLIGLDVLARPEREASVKVLGIPFSVGMNWAAATWAGDLGSAIADSVTRPENSLEWRSLAAASGAPTDGAFDFFLHTRAPDWDLLGDLDAWGITALREGAASNVPSLSELLMTYYEDLVQPDWAVRPYPRHRSTAVGRFLGHYGFTVPAQDLLDLQHLHHQTRPYGDVREAIITFAQFFEGYRRGWKPDRTSGYSPWANLAVDYFLFWLEGEVLSLDVIASP